MKNFNYVQSTFDFGCTPSSIAKRYKVKRFVEGEGLMGDPCAVTWLSVLCCLVATANRELMNRGALLTFREASSLSFSHKSPQTWVTKGKLPGTLLAAKHRQ